MSVKSLDELEFNSHLALYFLYQSYPTSKDKKEIANAIGLHYQTIRAKIDVLQEKSLVKSSKRGNKPFYFIDSEIKKIFDDWAETDIGKERVEAFELILSKNKENKT